MERQPLIVYLHGVPGSPRELELFGGDPGGLDLCAPERTRRHGSSSEIYLEVLATQIREQNPDGQVHLLGFSLGARVALELAARLGPVVSRIDLVSPAAPLELTRCLSEMAGQAVFRVARYAPWSFPLLAGLQGLAVRHAPSLIYDALFATTRGADIALAERSDFQAMMKNVLADCLAGDAGGYREEVIDYVQPWAHILRDVLQPVTLWHGEADNWSPIVMSEALATALPNVDRLHRLPGLSHYTTLQFLLRDRLRR